MRCIDLYVARLRIVDVDGDVGTDDAVAIRIDDGQRLGQTLEIACMDLAFDRIEVAARKPLCECGIFRTADDRRTHGDDFSDEVRVDASGLARDDAAEAPADQRQRRTVGRHPFGRLRGEAFDVGGDAAVVAAHAPVADVVAEVTEPCLQRPHRQLARAIAGEERDRASVTARGADQPIAAEAETDDVEGQRQFAKRGEAARRLQSFGKWNVAGHRLLPLVRL